MVVALSAATAARADTTTILIFPFENLSNDRTLEWIGEGIAELMVSRLQSEAGLDVFSRDERLSAYEKLSIPEVAVLSRATALKLGFDSGADYVITGTFSGSAGDFHLDARLIDLEGGASTPLNVDGQLQDVIPLTTTLAWNILRKIIPETVSPETDYTARPPAPRSAFENYIRALVNMDLQKRVDLLQNAVRLHPQYSAALYQLGRTYHLQRNFALSNQSLDKVPETAPAPDRRQVLFLKGLNYFYTGDFARAITSFQQLPATYDVLLNLGAAFSRKGDAASAISAWQRAAALDPLSSDAFFNMGYSAFLNGDFEGAEKTLGVSLKLRARDSEALFLLGRCYEKRGRLQESRRLIARASRLSQRVERWSNRPIPRLERFAPSTAFRDYDELWTDRRIARRARTLDLPSWLDIVQRDIDSYLFGDALRDLRDLMKIFPDSSEARSLLNEIDRQRNLR